MRPRLQSAAVPDPSTLALFCLASLAFLIDGSYALLAARVGGWLRARPWVQRAQGRFTGGVYIALGATAASGGARASAK